MKRKNVFYLSVIFLFIVIITMTGCNNLGVQNVQNKTEYKVNEEAFIDHFQIICTKYDQIENNLKVNYTVTNNSNEKTKINLQTDFKLYISDSEFINSSETGVVNLESSETKQVTINFNLNTVSKEINKPYKVLFYSNVVSNNIGFILD